MVCITATAGAQRKYQAQSSRNRLTPAACIVLRDRSGCPRESCLHRAGPGRRGLGPRTSLQHLEPQTLRRSIKRADRVLAKDNPVIELLRRCFGIEPRDDGRKRLETVTHWQASVARSHAGADATRVPLAARRPGSRSRCAARHRGAAGWKACTVVCAPRCEGRITTHCARVRWTSRPSGQMDSAHQSSHRRPVRYSICARLQIKHEGLFAATLRE